MVRSWSGHGQVRAGQGRSWSGHGQVMVRSWSGHGQVMVRSWSGHGHVMVRSWSGHGQVMVRSWSGHGQVMVMSWSGHGQVMVIIAVVFMLFAVLWTMDMRRKGYGKMKPAEAYDEISKESQNAESAEAKQTTGGVHSTELVTEAKA